MYDDNDFLILCLILPVVLGFALYQFYNRQRKAQIKPGWISIAAGNALLLVWLLSLLLLGGEIWFRYFCDRSDALSYTKLSQRWFERHFHNNSGQCRDDIDYIPAITPGTRRLSFLGDSFTAGHGVKDVNDRFANIIRSNNPTWEVHALARPGFDTGTENKFLEVILTEGYQFDEVVLVYCLNDISDLYPEWMDAVKKINEAADGGTWWFRYSYFLNTLYFLNERRNNPSMKDYFSFIKEGYQGDKWQEQKERLKRFHEIIKANGGKLRVVTFPFMQNMGNDYDYSEAHKALNAFWAEQSVPHLDLLPAFLKFSGKDLVVNPHDPHPNEKAHEVAAVEIEKFLNLPRTRSVEAKQGQ